MPYRVVAFALVVLNTGRLPAPATRCSFASAVSFNNAAAADVINALAAAAGVTAEIRPGAVRPVTVTLTNVKLRTALDAICDNALCSWRFSGSAAVVIEPGLPTEPVSFIRNAPTAEVLNVARRRDAPGISIRCGDCE